MATVEVKKCDVFGTQKDIREVHIIVRYKNQLIDDDAIFESIKDMSPRAVKRLVMMLGRATSPPNPQLGRNPSEPDGTQKNEIK